MTTITNIKNEFLIRIQGNTSVAFYTDTILNEWLTQSYRFTCSYKKWPFTEGKISTTYSTPTDDEGFGYPEGWKSDSVRHLEVGGKRFRKLSYYDYRGFREDNSDDTSKIFSDFGRRYYINPKADVSGTIAIWGQYTPAIDITDGTSTTIFSGNEEEGNEAMVEEMLSYAKIREKKIVEAKYHHEKATTILDAILERIKQEQFGYHSRKDQGMFERIDIVEGELYKDTNNPLQF